MPPSHWHVGTSKCELQDAASSRVTGKGVNSASGAKGLHDAAPRTSTNLRTTCYTPIAHGPDSPVGPGPAAGQ